MSNVNTAWSYSRHIYSLSLSFCTENTIEWSAYASIDITKIEVMRIIFQVSCCRGWTVRPNTLPITKLAIRLFQLSIIVIGAIFGAVSQGAW
jgi:hypothetical protein